MWAGQTQSLPFGAAHSSFCLVVCFRDMGRGVKLIKGRLTDQHQSTERNVRAV